MQILYSIVSYTSIVLIHHVHFYMVLLVMYSNLNLLEISYSPWMFELNILYFMLKVVLMVVETWKHGCTSSIKLCFGVMKSMAFNTIL